MIFSLDNTANMDITILGIIPNTKQNQKELIWYAFLKDRLSYENTIEAMHYPCGRSMIK